MNEINSWWNNNSEKIIKICKYIHNGKHRRISLSTMPDEYVRNKVDECLKKHHNSESELLWDYKNPFILTILTSSYCYHKGVEEHEKFDDIEIQNVDILIYILNHMILQAESKAEKDYKKDKEKRKKRKHEKKIKKFLESSLEKY